MDPFFETMVAVVTTETVMAAKVMVPAVSFADKPVPFEFFVFEVRFDHVGIDTFRNVQGRKGYEINGLRGTRSVNGEGHSQSSGDQCQSRFFHLFVLIHC